MNNLKYFLIILLVSAIFTSCGTSVMMTRSGNKIKNHHISDHNKRYKHMKDCEEKFMRRFNRIYSKQQKKQSETEITTPFFSTNASINKTK